MTLHSNMIHSLWTKLGEGKLTWLTFSHLMGSYLSSRNYDSNIHSEQLLNVEKDFFFQISFYRNECGARCKQFLF